MNRMVQKLTKTKYTYLKPFLDFSNQGKHLSEISKILGEPHPTIRRHLNNFEIQNILKKINKGRLTIYSLNKENPLLIDYLVLAEKDFLLRKTSKNLILKEIVSFLHSNFKGKKILIFGSACEDTKKANDIDILIVGNTKNSFSDLENLINKKIHLVNVQSLEKINNALKTEIKKKHLFIEGTEDFIKWLI